MNSDSLYYVYAYLRSVDSDVSEAGTPYYIGKGKGRRAYKKRQPISLPKDKKNIILLHENLTEAEAFELEKKYIAEYGRVDLGTGILRNRTDGGDGSSGFMHSEETKRKLSELNSGENHPMYGKTLPNETKRKITEKIILLYKQNR
jgi:hypothetical protein